MTRSQKIFALTALLSLALATPSFAQKLHEPAHAPKLHEPAHEWPLGFGALGLYTVIREAGLSQAQMRRIEEIIQGHKRTLEEQRVEVEKKERDLKEYLDLAQVDRARVEATVDALLEARTRLSKTTTMMMVQMREVLTQEQWRRMQELQRQLEHELAHQKEASFPPTGAKRVRVGAAVQAAKAIFKAKPEFPPQAKQARIQGTVLLEALIDVNGAVSQLRVVSGHPLLVQAALDAVRQWRYQPTLLNNEPVEVLTTIDVVFTLSQ